MAVIKRAPRIKSGRQANIYDVAKAAGVSIATISRAMNNREVVSSDTLTGIEEAMRKLNYRPNHNAKCLAQQKSNQIAVFLSSHDEVHYSMVVMAVLVGIIRGAEKYQLRVVIHLLVREKEDDGLWNNATGLEGAIVLNDMKKTSAAARDLETAGVPLVYINCTQDRNKHRINADDRVGGRRATEFLIEQGHERIAFLTGEMDTISAIARVRGCQDALKAKGLLEKTEKARFFRNARYNQKIAYAETLDILAQSAKPTAIFAASDWMAMGALTAIREKGLRVPEDISLVGYDDSILASQITPPLTTIRQPFIEMGTEAVVGLMNIKENPKNVYEKILTPELVVRDSTRAR